MAQFFKYVLATILGIFLTVFLLMVIGGGIAASFSSGDKVNVKPNTVLKASFNMPINERSSEDPFAALSGEDVQSLGLEDILKSIKAAKEDDNIKGIYLDLLANPSGLATIDEIRDELIDFKKSGKFIIAYGEILTQKAYYLASVADEIYLNPVGAMELKGFSREITFYKGMLEKLEITPQFFYVGKYKSATEPFRFKEMSEPNREQVKSYLGDFYERFIKRIAPERNMTEAQLKDIVENLKIRKAKDAVDLGVVDGLKYYDEVEDAIRAKLGYEEDDKKVNFMSVGKYAGSVKNSKYEKEKIAIVYAQGGIESGEGDELSIGSGKYAKTLRKIRKDDKVKAVVLRVNSPGGSALASDVILREVELIKEAGKPVVVSMGDVAASGGYYISCNADSIFAQENTITGSIGVFGMIPIIGEMLENKLGITTDRVKTAENSDFLTTVARPLNEVEKTVIQKNVEKVYDDFLNRVEAGRNMDSVAVNEIAQGRVWTGSQAKEIGLVDRLGGIDEAVACAARMANLEKYRLSAYPKKLTFEEKIMKKLSGDTEDEVATKIMQSELGEYYQHLKTVKDLIEMDPIQMRLPYNIEVE